MSLQFTIVGTEDGSNITVFIPGQAPLVAHSSHPNYEKIVEGVMAQDESVAELFDVAQTAATKFERLTERVTVASGRLYLDGVEVDNALATQVLRFLDEGVEDWKPLVNFFENVQQNPQEYSREQLYNWLNTENFTITPNGLIVGYKGVKPGPDEDTWLSINSGRAIVDGEVHNGNIPNRKGSVVEMPRNEVTFDPENGCSQGLHVGTYGYANGFGQGGLLEVHVNPRDVVSVPNDSHSQKMRVCRYLVVDTIEKPYEAPVSDDYWDEDEDFDEWGDEFDNDPFEGDGFYNYGNDDFVDGEVVDIPKGNVTFDNLIVIDSSGSMDNKQLVRAADDAAAVEGRNKIVFVDEVRGTRPYNPSDPLGLGANRDSWIGIGGGYHIPAEVNEFLDESSENRVTFGKLIFITDAEDSLGYDSEDFNRIPDHWDVRIVKRTGFEPKVWGDVQPIPALSDDVTPDSKQVNIGDRFEDTDPRRKGNVFTVEAIEDGKAVGKGRLGLKRKIKLDRLVSRKYRKLS